MFDLNFIGKVKVNLSELTKAEFLKLSKEAHHDGKGYFHIFFVDRPGEDDVEFIFSHWVSSAKIQQVVILKN